MPIPKCAIPVTASVCAHPWCGTRTACCRPGCPIRMLQIGNGRWQWALPGDAPTDAPWPHGINPNGYSSENWES